MRTCRAVFFIGLCALLTGTAWTQDNNLGGLPRSSPGITAVQDPRPPERPCEQSHTLTSTQAGQVVETEQQYRKEIQLLFDGNRFDSLDKEADRVRASKERVLGGTWKLYLIYDVISQPVTGGWATDANWKDHIEKLKTWVAARPQSITARVALAHAYVWYAGFARGDGYADTVSESDWKLFRERLGQASETLKEAQKLPAKCPEFYHVTLLLARGQSWPLDAIREVFERAIAFEPSYYHSYRELAYTLLPKWSGEEGDAEAFAEESARRIGGEEGAFVYFEIATTIYCLCATPPDHPTLSWPKIQEGFAVMEKRYGASMTKINRFAALAYSYKDRTVAKRALERVGENWEITAWGKRSTFDQARAWAQPEVKAGGPGAPSAFRPFPTAPDPRVVQWQKDMGAAWNAAFSRQYELAESLYRKAVQETEQFPPVGETFQALPSTLRAFGEYYARQGKFPEAERMLRRSLEVSEQRVGKGNFETQSARESLANMYMRKRDYTSAERIAKEMVEIAEHNPPAGYDPMLPQWLDFQASLYYSQEKFEQAQPLYERALVLGEKLEGPDSIAVAVRLDHLGALYRAEGAFDKAEPLFRRELDLDELQNGKSSPMVQGALSQLADLMKKMGRYEEAKQFQQRWDAIQSAQAHR